MKRYMRGLFILFCSLAAIGPGLGFIRLVRAREFSKTFTKYGPLPEIHVTAFDWVLFVLAIILLFSVILELFRFRAAPPLALISTLLLWIYFGPGLWAHIAGNGFFEPTPSHSTSLPWQQIVYQIGATFCSTMLTYFRYVSSKPGSMVTVPDENGQMNTLHEKTIL